MTGCFDIMSSLRIAANSRKDPSSIQLGVQCLPELQSYKLFTIQHCFLFKQPFFELSKNIPSPKSSKII